MRDDLSEAQKNGGIIEILWVGRCDGDGRICDAWAAARGDATSVPALFPHMSRGDVVIHNHPQGDLRPSGADLAVASRLGNQGIGFLIVDPQVQNVNVVVTPLAKHERMPLNVEELRGVLEPGGTLDQKMSDFESRDEQVELLGAVAQAFNHGSPLVAEAGTGVGKSFAYLLPALQWVSNNEERVVISTATIALQQQLMEKDIPLAMKLLDVDVKTALVKGRGNYLCLKRLQEAGEAEELFGGGDGIQGIRSWAEESTTGSKSDLPFQPEPSAWARVRSESDNCPGAFCPFFDRCFLMKARRQASESSLLVANHHLLFADLAARREGAGEDETVVLPAYRSIVFDEAHHLESSATALFSQSLSLPALNRVLFRLWNKKGKFFLGIFPRLAGLKSANADVFLGQLPPLIEAVRGKAENWDALARDLFGAEHHIRFSGDPSEGERTRFLAPLEELRKELSKLSGQFAEAFGALDEEQGNPEIEGLLVEARQAAGVLQEALSVADAFLHRDEYPHHVFHIEATRRSDGRDWIEAHQTPLSVASLVRESVWEPFGTVVGVSATLAVGGRFDHWRRRVGATNLVDAPHEAIYPSPFDYASQVMLAVPSDAPSPEEGGVWENFLIQALSESIEISGGHALVLFTSYQTLKRTLVGVRSTLGDSAPVLLAQGDDDRGRLLKRFRDNPSSVLFATDSFWEGVDVPGEALKMVIITRLPFRPPTDPVGQARSEAVAARGGRPFFELSLPDAVTRFRQGFGRLMRRRDDHGAVLVLDSRICRKNYGSLFLNSLPPACRCVKPWQRLLEDVEDFLYSK